MNISQVFTSFFVLSAVLLIVSFAVQWITPENSKRALWLAFIGGYGVSGGANGGWLANAIQDGSTKAVDVTNQVTSSAVGAGVGVVIVIIGMLWFSSKAGKKGNGLKSGTKKKDKIFQGLYLVIAAIIGALIQLVVNALIPSVYGAIDGAIAMAGSAVLDLANQAASAVAGFFG